MSPHRSKQDENVELSKIDFDGDNNTDSYLEVTFQDDGLLGEVQIGVPYVDPYANLDDSNFGWIEGKVTDIAGNPLDEYDVMFFRKPDSEIMSKYISKLLSFLILKDWRMVNSRHI